MSKTVLPFTGKVVNFNTTLCFVEVISRLESEINKAGSANIIGRLRTVQNQEEFMAVVKRTIGQDFLYFSEMPHSKLLKFVDGVEKPRIVVYTVGNPIIAQKILKYNPLAAYSIPPRLLIIEEPQGTTVSYHLPSTVMGVLHGENHPILQAELELLDGRVERLAAKITAVRSDIVNENP